MYEEKLRRLEDCADLKSVDRVPIGVAELYFPAKYAGFTYQDMYYDNEKYTRAAIKFAEDFDWDAVCFLRSFETIPLGLSLVPVDAEMAVNVAIASVMGGGSTHDILRDRYISHPGRELPENNESHFIIQDTFMDACEYESFAKDPFCFLSEKIVPRVYENLQKPGSNLANETFLKLGFELNDILERVAGFTETMKKANCPPWYLALAPNPLDFIGAFVRNFDKVLMDIHRNPDEILTICEKLTPVFMAVGKATGLLSHALTGSKRVFMPVWYNSFLSKKEYLKFQWPYIKTIAEGLIAEGFTPLLSLQGEYDHLLDTLLELPKGKFIAWFDRTDPIEAKKVIGEHCCIAGGISAAALISKQPEDIDEYVKKLLEEMKKSSGFIYTLPFNGIGPAKIENVKAMTAAVRKYGKY